MKLLRIVICFSMLLGLFFHVPAYAEEHEVGMNGDEEYNCLIGYKGDVYCLVNAYTIKMAKIYRITNGQPEKIYCAAGIDEIFSHAEGIVLVRRHETLDSAITRWLSGRQSSVDISIELLNPDTCSSIEWERCSIWSALDVFSLNGNLYMWVKDAEDGFFLKKYEAPYVSQTLLHCSSEPKQYPSFSLTSLEPKLLKRNAARVSLYDIIQNQQHETRNAMSLLYSYDTHGTAALQAVLQDDNLFYLTKDSLCKYSFAENTNQVILSYDTKADSYDKFTLTSKYAICFSGSYRIDVYDLETGQCMKKLSSSVETQVPLYYDNVLYLCTAYGSNVVEMIDFDGFVQTCYELKD